MSSAALCCPICYGKYNQAECTPRMIPKCGHTICSQCLGMLLKNNKTSRCPLDKGLFSYQQVTVQNFPINYTVQHLIEETSKWDVCEDHNEEARLICVTDKCRVCHDCVYEGKHKGHDVKSLNKVRLDLENDVKGLDGALGGLNKHYEEILNAMEEERASYLNFIKTRFRDVRMSLKKKELELWYKVNAFFDMEKSIANNLFGKKSSVRTEITEKIAQRRDMLKSENFFPLPEDDLTQAIAKIDQVFLDKSIKEVSEKLQEELNCLDSLVSAHIDSISNIDFSGTEVFESIYSGSSLLWKEKEPLKMLENSSYYKFNTCLKVSAGRDCATIKVSAQEPQNIVINSRELRLAREVKIEVEKDLITKEDTQALCYVLNSLSAMSSLKVHFNFSVTANGNLINLFPIVFIKTKGLSHVEVSFKDPKVDDEIVTALIRNVLSQLPDLKGLHLNLSSLKVTNNTLEVFAEKMLPIMKSFEDFTLRLDKTGITNEGVKHIIAPMPQLRTFRLDIDRTPVTDLCIEKLTDDMLSTMRELVSFEIWLSKTGVTDKGIIHLLKKMPNVKTLILGLGNTEISDESVEVFVKEVLPKLAVLEDLRMYLDQTRVSAEKLLIIKEVKEKRAQEGIANWMKDLRM